MSIQKGLQTKLTAYGWVVSSLAALFYSYEYILRIEPSVMVPQLMHYFNITASGLGILTAMYYFIYTPLQAVVGIFTDYFGPKRVLVIAIIFCVAGAFLFGSTRDIYLAAFGRFLIGAGSAFAFVGTLKMAAIWLPQKRFALFAGLAMTLGMVGAIFGDVALSWAVKHFGWHRIIISSAIFGTVLIPIFILFIRSKKDHASRQEHRSSSLQEGFIKLLKMFKQPIVIYGGVIGGILYLSLSVVGELWGIPFIQGMTHHSKIVAASVNSAIFFGWMIGAPLNGWISDKVKSRKKPMIVGAFMSAIIFSGILIWPVSNIYLLGFLLFLFGLFCSVEIITFALARDVYSIKFTGTAVAVINLLIMLGGVILQPLVGYLLTLVWSRKMANGIPIYGVNDYRQALVIIPLLLIIAGILAIKLKETYGYKKVEH